MKNIARTALASAAILAGSFAGLGAGAAEAAPVSNSPAVDCSRSGAINPTVRLSVNSPMATAVSEWALTRTYFFRWTASGWARAGGSGWQVVKAPTTVNFGSFSASPGYYLVGFETYRWNGSSWVDRTNTWAPSYTVWAPGSQTQNTYCVVKNLTNTPF